MDGLQVISTPIGFLKIQASSVGLTEIKLFKEEPKESLDLDNEHTRQAAFELLEYFEGKRKDFSVNLDWDGHSEFYKSVWSYLVNIPIGETRSYGEIAKQLNNPGASRAVGLANGKNPIMIIVPCHRVIGSNGALTGFASGIDIKEQLLAHENPDSFALQGTLF